MVTERKQEWEKERKVEGDKNTRRRERENIWKMGVRK